MNSYDLHHGPVTTGVQRRWRALVRRERAACPTFSLIRGPRAPFSSVKDPQEASSALTELYRNPVEASTIATTCTVEVSSNFPQGFVNAPRLGGILG